MRRCHSQRSMPRARACAWLVLLFTILFLLAAGCGDKRRSMPDPVQACELLSDAEVEALVGGPVEAPQKHHTERESPPTWSSMCNYYSAEKQISLGITVLPHGRSGGASDVFAAHEAELKDNLGADYTLERVPGLGEHAGWQAGTKQLTLVQGPYLVIVGVVSPKLAPTEALVFCRQVAAKILPRLSGE